MKRLFQVLAVVTALVLGSCTADTSNYRWLKLTVWEADLSGRDVDGLGVIETGLLKYRFNLVGYSFQCELRTSPFGGFMSRVESKGEIEYNYPSIRIPYGTYSQDQSGTETVIYNEGTFTKDNKTLHFDSFVLSDNLTIQDVDFIRK